MGVEAVRRFSPFRWMNPVSSTVETSSASTSFFIEGDAILDGSTPRKAQISVDRARGLVQSVETELSRFVAEPDFLCPSDSLLMPGFLDIHVHAREDATGKQNDKETYGTALDAALNGGVVCVGAMPNTPRPLTDGKEYRWHRQRLERLDHPVECFNYVGVGTGTCPMEKGKHFYKAYTGPSVGDLFFRNAGELEQALARYEGENVSFHVEDFDVLERNGGGRTHRDRRPPECVLAALRYLLPLVEKYSLRAKLCHWSVGRESIDLIEGHRNRMEKLNLGYNTTVEVSPMHLLFNADDLEDAPWHWPRLQMNPALQSRSDQRDLIQALKDGVIDYLATDHAPHRLDEKYRRFAEQKDRFGSPDNETAFVRTREQNPALCVALSRLDGVSGAPWLDTYGLVLGWLRDVHGFSYGDLARVSAKNPGNFVGPYLESKTGGRFGVIERGALARFSLVDFSRKVEVSREKLMTKCGWSALEGWEFPVAVLGVLINDRFFPSRFRS